MRFLSLVLLLVFAAFSTFANAAQADDNATAGISRKAINKKVRAKKKAQAKTKSATATEYTQMSSKLDEFDRSVYTVNNAVIKARGYRNTESLFKYVPFVNVVNTGQGAHLDIRNQGIRANSSVKILINGVPSNTLLDTYNGLTTINTIVPSMIEDIEILPGGNSILYGSGTNGGVVNISTFKRFDKPVFTVGVGYNYYKPNSELSNMPSYNADVQFRDKFGKTYVSVGVAYFDNQGLREKDSQEGFEATLGLLQDFGDSSLSLDIDYFRADVNVANANSFYNLRTLTWTNGFAATFGDEREPNKDYRGYTNYDEDSYDPPSVTQDRIASSLNFSTQLSKNLLLDVRGILNINKVKYNDGEAGLYTRINYQGRHFDNVRYLSDTSSFNDNKYGIQAKIDYKHRMNIGYMVDGRFILGFDSIYHTSNRKIKRLMTGDPTYGVYSNYDLDSTLNANKWTNSIYAQEQYNLTKNINITGGIRYEHSSIKSDIDENHGFYYTRGTETSRGINTIAQNSIKDTTQNVALELTPSFKYSKSGTIFAKYERGFSTPPANYLFNRYLTIAGFRNAVLTNNNTPLITNGTFTGDLNTQFPAVLSTLRYNPSDLPNETYNSFEFGVRDLIANSMMVMANVFYTGTNNEFYARKNDNPIIDYTLVSGNFIDTTAVGVDNTPVYGVYDKTRRMGVEVAMEQYFYGGILAYESFSYVKAQYKDSSGSWVQIPYTYDYKATLGVNFELFSWLNIWTNNTMYGRQEVAYSEASQTKYEKLKPYILSDAGITINIFNGSISAGVRNIADKFYYDYYNRDIRDPIVGYGYLIGQGRTYFIEGRYTY